MGQLADGCGHLSDHGSGYFPLYARMYPEFSGAYECAGQNPDDDFTDQAAAQRNGRKSGHTVQKESGGILNTETPEQVGTVRALRFLGVAAGCNVTFWGDSGDGFEVFGEIMDGLKTAGRRNFGHRLVCVFQQPHGKLDAGVQQLLFG